MSGIIYLLESRKTGKQLRVILDLNGECRLVAKDIDTFFFGEEGHSRALKLLEPGVSKTKYTIPQNLMLPGERVAKLSTVCVDDLAHAALSIRNKVQREQIHNFCNTFKVFMIGITHEAKLRVWREEQIRWIVECNVCHITHTTASHKQAVGSASRHIENFHNLKLVSMASI